MRLRILADFPGLIHFPLGKEDKQVASAFTIEDLHNRKGLFAKERPTIFADPPKYQALLKLLQGSWPSPAKSIEDGRILLDPTIRR